MANILTGLGVLQKKTFAWPFDLWPTIDIVDDFTRICTSLPLRFNGFTAQMLADAQAVLAAHPTADVNMTCNDIFTKCRLNSRPPDYWGQDWADDLNAFKNRLAQWAPLAAKIKWFLMDDEQWSVNSSNEASLMAKFLPLTEHIANAGINCQYIWYNRNNIETSSSTQDGYVKQSYQPNGLPGYSSCSAYYAEHIQNQNIYSRSQSSAGSNMVVPLCSMGSAYHRQANGWEWREPGPISEITWRLGCEFYNANAPQQTSNFQFAKAKYLYVYHEATVPSENWLNEFVVLHNGAYYVTPP